MSDITNSSNNSLDFTLTKTKDSKLSSSGSSDDSVDGCEQSSHNKLNEKPSSNIESIAQPNSQPNKVKYRFY